MKIFKVRIFTEEYSIVVYIGTKKQIISAAARFLNCSYKAVENDFGNCRGRAWNALDDVYGNKMPLMIVDGDMPVAQAMATVAHEASHCMDFIERYIGLNDVNGEFHAHGISAVMRAVGKVYLQEKK